jgi:predicted secreted hydrolase
MESTNTEDRLQGIHVYCSSDGIEYDLTFKFTSPVLLNAALGSYLIGGELGYEWSLPREATEGWVKIDREVVNVVPEKSFTRYDRQWGSLQDSFTWMMLHLERRIGLTFL